MRSAHDTDDKDDMDDLSRLYAQAPAAEPPAALDDAVLAQARRALEAGSAPARRPRWELPLATAAVVMLSVLVVMNVERERPDVLEVASPARPQPSVSAEVSGGIAPERWVEAERRDAGPVSGPGADAPAKQTAPPAGVVPPRSAAPERRALEKSPGPAIAMGGGASGHAGESRMRDVEAAASAAGEESSMAGSAAAPAPPAAPDSPLAGPAAPPPRGTPVPAPQPLAEAPAADRVPSAAAIAERAPSPAAAGKAAGAVPAPARAAARPAAKPAPMAAPSSLAQARSRYATPALAPADMTPGEWFEYLKALRAEGRSREFKEALEEFRSRFPGVRIPPELLAGDEPQD